MAKKRAEYEIVIKGTCSPKWIKDIKSAKMSIGDFVELNLIDKSSRWSLMEQLNAQFNLVKNKIKNDERYRCDALLHEDFIDKFHPSLENCNERTWMKNNKEESIAKMLKMIMEDCFNNCDKYFEFIELFVSSYFLHIFPKLSLFSMVMDNFYAIPSKLWDLHEYRDAEQAIQDCLRVFFNIQQYSRIGESQDEAISRIDEINRLANLEGYVKEHMDEAKLILAEYLLFIFRTLGTSSQTFAFPVYIEDILKEYQITFDEDKNKLVKMSEVKQEELSKDDDDDDEEEFDPIEEELSNSIKRLGAAINPNIDDGIISTEIKQFEVDLNDSDLLNRKHLIDIVHIAFNCTKGEARKLISQGGIYIDDERVTHPDMTLAEILKPDKYEYHSVIVRKTQSEEVRLIGKKIKNS